MVQPNKHARNPIAIDPQYYFFSLQKEKKKSPRFGDKLKREY
jgi:hypothetical protein